MARLPSVLIAISLSGLTWLPATAQSHIGLLAGPTASTLTGSFPQGSDGTEIGVNFRGTLDTHLFQSVWLSTGIGIYQKGGRRITLPGTGGTTGYRTMYLTVPFLVRPQVEISQSQWFIAPFTGPSLGFNIGCSVKPGDQFEFEESCDETTPGGQPTGVEVSVPIGFDFWRAFPGGSKFVFEVRYDIGLTNALSAASDAGQSARNNMFTAMLGFALPLYEVTQ